MDSRLVLPANTVLDGSYLILQAVGSGGFGITYAAEDTNLGTLFAVKEYYPADFADRDATMSVRPKSDRHKKTFEWGRSSFLQEARMLARFRHPSVVQVTRVFEAYSTAYMVMVFENGQDFGRWLKGLGRLPSQEELDRIAAPLLDALDMMHAANFLHRDIAPDNIIIRPDGTPVLLDFGAARRAVAEASRSITGIVKAGYSPHEQYSSDNRLQGPWSDIYALGATFYRAVTGRSPEEATLRVDVDSMASATQATTGIYRPSFLAAIDACLRVKQSERPQTVGELRPSLLGQKTEGKERLAETGEAQVRQLPVTEKISTGRPGARRWRIAAAIVLALLGGVYSGFEYTRWNVSDVLRPNLDWSRKVKEEEERRQKEQELADARRRQIEVEEARWRKELVDAAAAEARRKAEAAAEATRKEEERIAVLEEVKRKEEEALRKIDAEEKRRSAEREEARKRAEVEAETKRKEEQRTVALEEVVRRRDEKRREDERARLAADPSDEQRTAFLIQVQQVLKRTRCYDGALTKNVSDIQQGFDKFVEHANRRGQPKAMRLDLAKASVGDFETWLKKADAIKDGLCISPDKPIELKTEKPKGPGQFDGAWTITWTGDNNCRRTNGAYALRIQNSVIVGGRTSTGVPWSGSVSATGAVRWRASNSHGPLNYSGRFVGNSGSGSFSNVECTGTFIARRN